MNGALSTDSFVGNEQEKMDYRFHEFVDLVKNHVRGLLISNLWNISDLELINNDYNFTNWVFRYSIWGEKFVVKTNFWGRSIWTNFRLYLEDKDKFCSLLWEKECSELIRKQYEDYKTLNELWIPTIEATKIQLIDNFLIIPYIDGKDLWTFISEWYKDGKDHVWLFVSLQKLIQSLDKLYQDWLIYGDLKMDNLFISWNEVILLDPQIMPWNREDDIWKLIFSILLLCHHIWDIYWYDEFRKFFIETIGYSRDMLKTYRRCWYDIYKFLVTLHYPKNSKEVCMMQKFYEHLKAIYRWKTTSLSIEHKKDS